MPSLLFLSRFHISLVRGSTRFFHPTTHSSFYSDSILTPGLHASCLQKSPDLYAQRAQIYCIKRLSSSRFSAIWGVSLSLFLFYFFVPFGRGARSDELSPATHLVPTTFPAEAADHPRDDVRPTKPLVPRKLIAQDRCRLKNLSQQPQPALAASSQRRRNC